MKLVQDFYKNQQLLTLNELKKHEESKEGESEGTQGGGILDRLGGRLSILECLVLGRSLLRLTYSQPCALWENPSHDRPSGQGKRHADTGHLESLSQDCGSMSIISAFQIEIKMLSQMEWYTLYSHHMGG